MVTINAVHFGEHTNPAYVEYTGNKEGRSATLEWEPTFEGVPQEVIDLLEAALESDKDG